MKGNPIDHGDRENNSGRKSRKKREPDELISTNTIFTWRKNMAQEIQYLVKDKEGFYKLYLRNTN
jgi:hypothetical protein